jgi:hypothetical protein
VTITALRVVVPAGGDAGLDAGYFLHEDYDSTDSPPLGLRRGCVHDSNGHGFACDLPLPSIRA